MPEAPGTANTTQGRDLYQGICTRGPVLAAMVQRARVSPISRRPGSTSSMVPTCSANSSITPRASGAAKNMPVRWVSGCAEFPCKFARTASARPWLTTSPGWEPRPPGRPDLERHAVHGFHAPVAKPDSMGEPCVRSQDRARLSWHRCNPRKGPNGIVHMPKANAGQLKPVVRLSDCASCVVRNLFFIPSFDFDPRLSLAATLHLLMPAQGQARSEITQRRRLCLT